MNRIILAQTAEHVLCFLPDNTLTPFAVWAKDVGGGFSNGNYCRTLADALERFTRRANLLKCSNCGRDVGAPDGGVNEEDMPDLFVRTEDVTCACGQENRRRYILVGYDPVP